MVHGWSQTGLWFAPDVFKLIPDEREEPATDDEPGGIRQNQEHARSDLCDCFEVGYNEQCIHLLSPSSGDVHTYFVFLWKQPKTHFAASAADGKHISS